MLRLEIDVEKEAFSNKSESKLQPPPPPVQILFSFLAEASGFELLGVSNPYLNMLFHTTRLIVIYMLQAETQRARKYHAAASKKGEMLEKAADGLMGCFRVCASDRFV